MRSHNGLNIICMAGFLNQDQGVGRCCKDGKERPAVTTMPRAREKSWPRQRGLYDLLPAYSFVATWLKKGAFPGQPQA